MRARLRSLFAIALAAVVALAPSHASAGPSLVPAESGTPVSIPDPALKRCLSEHLEVDSATTLTTTQLMSVEALYCDGAVDAATITNLSGIEHLVNLTSLMLPNNALSSVSLPSALSKLEFVDLTSNRLTSFNLPSTARDMYLVVVDDNQLNSLTVPQTLTSLRLFSAADNRLTSLSLPDSATHLEFLDLTGNQLTSIALPQTISSLSELYLDGNRFSSLESLPYVGHLDVFSATGQTVTLPDTRVGAGFPVDLTDRMYLPPATITGQQGVTVSDRQLLYTAAGTYRLAFSTPDGVFSGTVVQRAVALPLVWDQSPSGKFGDHSGDGIGDLFAINEAGTLLFFTGSTTGSAVFHHEGNNTWGGVTYLTQIPDMTGDVESDLLARRGSDQSLVVYANGGYGSARVIGKNWGGMDQIVPVGNLAGGSTQYIVARRASDGALFRYTLTRNGLTGIKHIGQNWNGMKQLLSVGDFNRDGLSDLLAIRQDGTLWAYYGTATGIGHARQVGRGWNNFVQAFSPGDLSGDGVRDLVGQRADGVVFTYANRGGSWGSARQIMTGTMTYRLMA